MLESQREEIESAIEESQREMEYVLEEAVERQKQIAEEAVTRQKKITSEAWRLQAGSRIAKAWELIEAGMSDEAIKLSLEAIHQDPSNLYGYIAASIAFQNTGEVQEAINYLSKAIILLKTEEYKGIPSAYIQVLDSLSRLNKPENVVEQFKHILDSSIEMWTFADERGIIHSSVFASAVKLCLGLTAFNLLEQANKLSTRLTNRVINYNYIERFEVTNPTWKAYGHSWKEDKSIEHKIGLLSIFDILSKDNLDLFIRSGLLQGALKVSNHIIKLIEDKAREKGKDFQEYDHLIETLMYFVEASNYLSVKDADDFIVKTLKMIPTPSRWKIKEVFEPLKREKDAGKFSDRTINLIREKILQRYEEWRPKIEDEIRNDAREYAKREASGKKKPAVIGWIVGIGSYFILALISGGSAIPLALSVSIAFGIFAYWRIKQNIIAEYEDEKILTWEEDVRKSLDVILH